jgi:putative Ca2+/H+ antiporter (TMEM165/GDT1 family)
MELKSFLVVFGSVFLAELGDKTQLATLLFAAREGVSRWTVFAASALALVACSALGVVAGAALGERLDPRLLSRIAGVGFLALGAWTLWRA